MPAAENSNISRPRTGQSRPLITPSCSCSAVNSEDSSFFVCRFEVVDGTVSTVVLGVVVLAVVVVTVVVVVVDVVTTGLVKIIRSRFGFLKEGRVRRTSGLAG